MKTRDRPSKVTGWSIVFLLIIELAAIGLVIDDRALSAASRPSSKSAVGPENGRRDFIGVPNASSIVVQNILSTTADITVTFSLSDSTPIIMTVDMLPPESFDVYTSPEDFAGQGLVEAEAEYPRRVLPIFAVNAELSDPGNDGYLGVSPQQSAVHCWHAPFTYNQCLPRFVHEPGGWTTEAIIQNLGANPAVLCPWFYDHDGVCWEGTCFEIPTGHTFTLGWPDPDSSFSGSVFIEATEPFLAGGVRMNHPGGWRGSHNAGEAGTVGNVLIAPALFREHDLQTSSLCVQNAGLTDNTVTVRYSDGITREMVIPFAGSVCIDQDSEGHAPGWAGGAIITADENILAVVDVTASSGEDIVGRWSYSLPTLDKIASGTVALPLLLNNRDWTTTIHLYNPGDDTATVSPRYVSQSGFTYCAAPVTIPVSGTASLSQSELPRFMEVTMGYLWSDRPVAAAVSATSQGNLGDADRHFGYEAAYPHEQLVPQNPCGTVSELFLPLVMRQAP